MRIDIITVLPDLFGSFFDESIIGRAQKKGLVEIHVHNLRDYTKDKHKRVDDYPFGGGSGMIMQIQPIADCIAFLKEKLMTEKGEEYDEIIYTSPDGGLFSQPVANELSQKKNIIILCGHYKGIDQRVRDKLITRELSVGDYVLTGGELPAAVMTDAIVRVIPGAIGDSQAALDDCFQDGLLAPPIYTRPANYEGFGSVPEILLCGDPKKIREWEIQQAIERTRSLRPNLLDEK
ncbi:MAG: tRNA (guanosine(37)-N1)-methyltransferase TrmD [Bacteroidaceae bacterium]|nr:tRNA (guanosine(37)-N1)-methyltransferase TrmD [Bacteroidaceae bacterium]